MLPRRVAEAPRGAAAVGIRALECPPEDHTNPAHRRLLSEKHNNFKTFNNGSLGSGIDEERSEMR